MLDAPAEAQCIHVAGIIQRSVLRHEGSVDEDSSGVRHMPVDVTQRVHSLQVAAAALVQAFVVSSRSIVGVNNPHRVCGRRKPRTNRLRGRPSRCRVSAPLTAASAAEPGRGSGR